MIVIRVWNGLGNQLFQYAYARYLSEHSENQVLLENERWKRDKIIGEDLQTDRKYSLCYFRISLPCVPMTEMERWRYIENATCKDKLLNCCNKLGIEKNLLKYEDDIKSLTSKKFNYRNYYIIGIFQTLKFLQSMRQILLQELQLKKELNLSESINTILKEREVVAVHIRRGDYLTVQYLRSSVKRIINRNYYGKAIEYIADRVTKPVFFFFSDDSQWVKQNISCKYEHYYMDDLHLKDYEELVLMSKCKHHIIANSTFSFWGAWLCQNINQIVIAPTEMNKELLLHEWKIM